MTEQEFTNPIWDIQAGEPPEWFARFTVWLELGPQRTLDEAWRQWVRGTSEAKRSGAKRPNSSWYEKSREWRWRERATAYDLDQREKRIRADEEERLEMARRHVRIANSLQSVALEKLRDMQSTEGWRQMAPREVLQYIAEAIKIERAARGAPSLVLELQHLSDAELLDKYQNLLNTLLDKGGEEGDAPDDEPAGSV